MDNFSNTLNLLESLNRTFEIFVPSLNKKVKFKGLTTKQQKDAVKSALEKSFSGIAFASLLNSILNENSLEKNDYLLTDRSYIIVSLRALSLSPNLKRDDNSNLDLTPPISNNVAFPDTLKAQEIVDGNLKLTVSIPKISKDNLINAETKKKITPLPDDGDMPKEAVGEIFINELVKYIDKLTINNSGTPSEIEFDKLNFNQKIQILENLPISINSLLIDYINKVKEEEKKLFTINNQEINVEVDQTLFTV